MTPPAWSAAAVSGHAFSLACRDRNVLVHGIGGTSDLESGSKPERTASTAPSCNRQLAFCLMPNHWHLVLWPELDLARFMQKLTITHVRRWVMYRHRVVYGGVYQGRYKSFPLRDA